MCASFSAISMMTFAKFNRRFFEEGVQAFVLTTSSDYEKKFSEPLRQSTRRTR
jgi:hypothetical protein